VTGGPLPDQQLDEFGMMLFLAKPGRLHFRVLQTCESGSDDGSAVEVEGQAGLLRHHPRRATDA
jgi:hypothetical protein